MDQVLDHPGGVGAAIDIVSDMQKQRRGDWTLCQIFGDHLVQVGQLSGASMDVPNGVDTAGWRQDGRRLRQFDHCEPGYRPTAVKSTVVGVLYRAHERDRVSSYETSRRMVDEASPGLLSRSDHRDTCRT